MSAKLAEKKKTLEGSNAFWVMAQIAMVLVLAACSSMNSDNTAGEGGNGGAQTGVTSGGGVENPRHGDETAEGENVRLGSADETFVAAPPANATACTADNQCATGYCVDGFCCDSRCDYPCMACSAAKKGSGADGLCGSIAYDTDPDNDCPNGACDGKNQCKNYNGVACTTTAECLSNYCVDSFCCNNTCLSSCQACSAAKKGSGYNGVCGSIAAGTDPDNECNPGECTGSNSCSVNPQPKSPNGSACASADMCTSGYCTDGVCCDANCTGTCQACTALKKGSGSDGTCGFIPYDKDPDNECWGGACSGQGMCKQYNGLPCLNQAQCLSNYCVDGVCCGNVCTQSCYACSAGKKGQGYDGVCEPVAAGRDIDNECNPGECNGSGACNQTQAKSLNGVSCWTGDQCVSGYCVDGVCCGNLCTSPCTACTAAKKGQGFDGSCGPVISGNDPDNECNPGECNGSGTCNQAQSGLANGASCSLATQCASGFCVDGFCCNTACAGTCDACSSVKKGSGSNGTCGPIAYDSDPDNECALGACSGVSTCKYYNGLACAAPTDCLSNYCIDGYCCGNACETKCRACSAAKKGAGSDGVCGNIVTGADPDNECSMACGGSGACQPAPDGLACANSAECVSGNCVDGVCCDTACAGTCQACTAAKKGNGSDGTCGPIANLSDPDNECPLGKCDGNGVCTVLAANGAQCSNDAQCGSDHCVDGVCCDTACTGMCLACHLPGSVGTCSPIPVGQNDSTNAPPCLDICDGNGACVKDTGTACASGIECLSHICNAYVCEAPKPANGPLQWMTVAVIPNGWAGPYPLLKLNNMVAADWGADINGDTRDIDQYPAVLEGYFSTNGYCSLSKWNGMYLNWLNTFWEYIVKSGRGSATRWYQKTGLQSCMGNWGDGYSTMIVGSALGDTVHTGQSCDWGGDGTNFGNGSAQYGPVFVRKRAGYPNEITASAPAGMTSLMAYGPSGEVVWLSTGGGLSISKSPWGGGATTVQSIAGSFGSRVFAIDAGGNLIIAFSFSGNVDFGAGVLPGSGSRLGLVKLAPNGNVIWQKAYAGGVNLQTLFLAGDKGVVVKGNGTVNLGYGSTAGNTFGIRFDENGTALFHVNVTQGGGSDEQGGSVLVIDGNGSGDMYIGSTSWSTNWGWGTPMNGKYAITVAKYHQCNAPGGCKNLGAVCTSNDECGSGACVDGVCCNDACASNCAACTAAKKGFGTDGICQNIAANLDPEDECANGSCNGSGKCAAVIGGPCAQGNQCVSGFCVDGVCCNEACSGICQACTAAIKGSGSDGTCGGIAVGTDPQSECAGGSCSGAIGCSMGGNGALCTADTQCASGHCADGVCCDTACTGTCDACTAAKKGNGSNGTCGPIANLADPDNECPSGACDGASTCRLNNAQACSLDTQCLSAFCVDGYCCNSSCNGTCVACSKAKKGNGQNGTCGNIVKGTDPDAECGGLMCSGVGSCLATNGIACSVNGDCGSNFCRDGVCCDTSCNSTCTACSAAKKGQGVDGTCGPIASGTDPDNECSGSTCDGNAACALIPCMTGSDCPSGTCTNGFCAGFVKDVDVNQYRSCAVFIDGRVKCWGNSAGLGLNTTNVGDNVNEMGANLPFLPMGTGRIVKEVACGYRFQCALTTAGQVVCWGYNDYEQLGRSDQQVPDTYAELGDNLVAVNLGTGRTAVQLASGGLHSCAILDNGTVKCWGYNAYGQLGYGDTVNRGWSPSEMGDNLPAVDLGTGRTALAISAEEYSVCVLLDNGSVKCWGTNDYGQLGQGDKITRGDNPGEMGDNLPAINLGTGKTAVQISLGRGHACARLNDQTLKCWGNNTYGALGLGTTDFRGDQPGEMGDNLPAIDLGAGRVAVDVNAAEWFTCALLDNSTLKCWGAGTPAAENGTWNNLGDQPGEMGDNLLPVNLGTAKTVVRFSSRWAHSCAILNDNSVKCWGYNPSGQLGLGNTSSTPATGDSLPVVPLY